MMHHPWSDPWWMVFYTGRAVDSSVFKEINWAILGIGMEHKMEMAMKLCLHPPHPKSGVVQGNIPSKSRKHNPPLKKSLYCCIGGASLSVDLVSVGADPPDCPPLRPLRCNWNLVPVLSRRFSEPLRGHTDSPKLRRAPDLIEVQVGQKLQI